MFLQDSDIGSGAPLKAMIVFAVFAVTINAVYMRHCRLFRGLGKEVKSSVVSFVCLDDRKK
jgi:hypothetical protein